MIWYFQLCELDAPATDLRREQDHEGASSGRFPRRPSPLAPRTDEKLRIKNVPSGKFYGIVPCNIHDFMNPHEIECHAVIWAVFTKAFLMNDIGNAHDHGNRTATHGVARNSMRCVEAPWNCDKSALKIHGRLTMAPWHDHGDSMASLWSSYVSPMALDYGTAMGSSYVMRHERTIKYNEVTW